MFSHLDYEFISPQRPALSIGDITSHCSAIVNIEVLLTAKNAALKYQERYNLLAPTNSCLMYRIVMRIISTPCKSKEIQLVFWIFKRLSIYMVSLTWPRHFSPSICTFPAAICLLVWSCDFPKRLLSLFISRILSSDLMADFRLESALPIYTESNTKCNSFKAQFMH